MRSIWRLSQLITQVFRMLECVSDGSELLMATWPAVAVRNSIGGASDVNTVGRFGELPYVVTK